MFINLTQGKRVLVDDDDFKYLNLRKWYVLNSHGKSYAVRNSQMVSGAKRKIVLMHREILKPSNQFQVDHINGNGLDCRKVNLRLATHSQNKQNSDKYISGKTSIFKGVSYRQDKQRWRSQIRGKFIGYFESEVEAARSYNTSARKLFGKFAKLNKIK